MKLKVEKGFNINQEEAEKSATFNLKSYETSVSSALSTNNPGVLAELEQQIINKGSKQ